MLPLYSLGRTLINGSRNILTLPTHYKDPLPAEDLASLFKGATLECPGEAAATEATSSQEN